ncbi:MarR family winged helix-turn-helix transcriptional regulator [Anoxynatronum buryatiense]|uniref:DNA-binding transcriptional regulator, MarR family n=1 Tax=Anoxynatronum buryatiense TaxID=489973 RepID=A0AA45WWN5_9CLOT|nr:MarR family transcriptional regulator [Anoxynatronum buryatiense]SMP60236.1 DNA-binding transcriptional regulator, MarR family [Anoxynatronum buryatiense]
MEDMKNRDQDISLDSQGEGARQQIEPSTRTSAEGEGQARRLMTLLSTLSLFTRKTLLEWLPLLSSEMGITEERFMVMYELDLQPSISLKELATSLVVSSSSMSIMVNSLVEQGVVDRVQDTGDRRRVVLRLTKEGEKQLRLAEKSLLKNFEAYLDTLPETDRQALDDATGSLLSVMARLL